MDSLSRRRWTHLWATSTEIHWLVSRATTELFVISGSNGPSEGGWSCCRGTTCGGAWERSRGGGANVSDACRRRRCAAQEGVTAPASTPTTLTFREPAAGRCCSFLASGRQSSVTHLAIPSYYTSVTRPAACRGKRTFDLFCRSRLQLNYSCYPVAYHTEHSRSDF